MAYENERWSIPGAVASADLSAHQKKFVVLGATGVALNTVSGGKVDGVLVDKPAALNRGAKVCVAPSTVKVLVGANAILKGALVRSDANGLADTAGVGTYAAGRALDAGAAGTVITVQLQSFGTV